MSKETTHFLEKKEEETSKKTPFYKRIPFFLLVALFIIFWVIGRTGVIFKRIEKSFFAKTNPFAEAQSSCWYAPGAGCSSCSSCSSSPCGNIGASCSSCSCACASCSTSCSSCSCSCNGTCACA